MKREALKTTFFLLLCFSQSGRIRSKHGVGRDMQIKTIFQKQISEFHLEGAADGNLLGRKARGLSGSFICIASILLSLKLAIQSIKIQKYSQGALAPLDRD